MSISTQSPPSTSIIVSMVRDGAYRPYSISESMHSAEDGQVKQYLTLGSDCFTALQVLSIVCVWFLVSLFTNSTL